MREWAMQMCEGSMFQAEVIVGARAQWQLCPREAWGQQDWGRAKGSRAGGARVKEGRGGILEALLAIVSGKGVVVGRWMSE